MNTSFVQVSTPCLEKWSGMKSTGGGRFCGSCQRTVIDFTVMTDAEMILAMSQRKDGVCGRFRADQLNRPLRTYSPVLHTPRRFWGLLTAGLLWHTTQAQMNAPEIKTTESSVQTEKRQLPSIPSSLVASVDSSRIITGRVVEGEDGAGLTGVTVCIRNTYDYTYTYDTNTFKITVPVEQVAADVILTISHGDYVSLEIVVKPDQRGPILVTFTEKAVFMGEAAAVEPPKKPSFLDRLRNRFPATH